MKVIGVMSVINEADQDDEADQDSENEDDESVDEKMIHLMMVMFGFWLSMMESFLPIYMASIVAKAP